MTKWRWKKYMQQNRCCSIVHVIWHRNINMEWTLWIKVNSFIASPLGKCLINPIQNVICGNFLRMKQKRRREERKKNTRNRKLQYFGSSTPLGDKQNRNELNGQDWQRIIKRRKCPKTNSIRIEIESQLTCSVIFLFFFSGFRKRNFNSHLDRWILIMDIKYSVDITILCIYLRI